MEFATIHSLENKLGYHEEIVSVTLTCYKEIVLQLRPSHYLQLPEKILMLAVVREQFALQMDAVNLRCRKIRCIIMNTFCLPYDVLNHFSSMFLH